MRTPTSWPSSWLDSLLIGRFTYESFAGAWPHGDGELADQMNAMPKHVVSTALRSGDPALWNNSCVIGGANVPGAVRQLKAGDGGPILVAGVPTLIGGVVGALASSVGLA